MIALAETPATLNYRNFHYHAGTRILQPNRRGRGLLANEDPVMLVGDEGAKTLLDLRRCRRHDSLA